MWRVKSDQWRGSLHIQKAPSYAPRIIQFAIFGRGALFTLMGLFVVIAAWTGKASDAKGLAETLSWLRLQPFGIWLYITSALILLAYGYYSYTQARYTKLG